MNRKPFINIVQITFFNLLLIGLMTTACEDEHNDVVATANNRLNQLNEVWKGKQVSFDTTQVSSTKNILVYYNAECSSCLVKIKEWQEEIIPYFQEEVSVGFKFMLYAPNSPISLEYFLDEIGFEHNYVNILRDSSFLRAYPFLEDEPFNTILLDKGKRPTNPILPSEYIRPIFVSKSKIWKIQAASVTGLASWESSRRLA